jgi:Tol biopolymer transport system component
MRACRALCLAVAGVAFFGCGDERVAPREARTAAQIAFGSGGSLYVMRPDGSGRRRLTDGGAPAWSADGRRLAFERVPENSLSRLHVLGRRAPLTAPGVEEHSPAWSPDGRRLAFVRRIDRDGGEEYDIVVADVDGGGERVLRREVATGQARLGVWDLAWSPGGAHIVFTLTRLDRRHTFRPALYLMDANSGEAELLMRDAADAAWSPDGRRIAFSSVGDRNGESCWDQCHVHGELYVMDADGTDPVRLTRNRGDDRSPSWSPDGRRIAFESNRNRPRPRVGGFEVYSIRPDGSCLTWLTNGTPDSGEPAWRGSPVSSSEPGGCGATRRPPLVEVDTREVRRLGDGEAYWLGERYGNLLLGHAEVGTDRRGGRTYFFAYDDCARYRPRACPGDLYVQQASVCSRGRRPGTGPCGLTMIAGTAFLQITHWTTPRRGRRQVSRAARDLRLMGSPRAPRPAPNSRAAACAGREPATGRPR